MDWQQITGFVHTARLKSFTKAAEATFRTQPAVSQQILALETELGCRLIERRKNKPLRLTRAGERFYEFCQALRLQRRDLEQDLMSIEGLAGGQLKVAGVFTTLYRLLPDVFQSYLEKYPYVELTVVDRSQSEAVRSCREGEVDLVFVLESQVTGDFERVRWKPVEPVLLVHSAHPLADHDRVSLGQVLEYPLILPTHGLNRDILIEKIRQTGRPYRVALESSNVELSSVYAERGFGVAFATMVRDKSLLGGRNLKMVALTDWTGNDFLTAAWRSAVTQPQTLHDFLDILRRDQ